MFSANTTQVSPANYIEDVFSTWLYTGNGSTQTITNGIDLSTKGGLVWTKSRSNVSYGAFVDTVRGIGNGVTPSSGEIYTWLLGSGGENSGWRYSDITSFNTNGYSLGYTTSTENANGLTYASWTFRKQPKFFDIVTYTGTGANRTIAHNLGSVPGCIIVKCTNTSSFWSVYHRGFPSPSPAYYGMLNNYLGTPLLNTTFWNSTDPTSTVFSVGTNTEVNGPGNTYVAYLFAHDAGGFGGTRADNVISCGSFTTDGSGNSTVNLGYEPQWLLIKDLGDNQHWTISDNMRGLPAAPPGPTSAKSLRPSANDAESTAPYSITSTGFSIVQYPSTSYIYIAIRRGPMKTPTVGTSVFNTVGRNGTGAAASITSVGFAPDAALIKSRNPNSYPGVLYDRLRGRYKDLRTPTSDVENADFETNNLVSFDIMGVSLGTSATNGFVNLNANSYINYFFQRAPGFFDVACYTGNGTNQYINHNLTVVPEFIIAKSRSGVGNWWAYHVALGNAFRQIVSGSSTPTADNIATAAAWMNTTPTATQFRVGQTIFATSNLINDNGITYVAYLFATLAGVSKVGSYTGTGALQTVNCGFTTGARFILIKRTDSTGDWYVWDSTRGITSGNDPYFLLNTSSNEDTSTNYVDTDATGFKVTAAAPVALNASGGTYIFLAIA
jgi:hypothetical protein